MVLKSAARALSNSSAISHLTDMRPFPFLHDNYPFHAITLPFIRLLQLAPSPDSYLACSPVMPHRYPLSCCPFVVFALRRFPLRLISSTDLLFLHHHVILHYIPRMYYCRFGLDFTMKPAYAFQTCLQLASQSLRAIS